ncbi:sugar phosphorylase [Egibacter rhizosphaerae]|nr:sugar phosphorylase [Egibacter rhizosphaerae]
MTTPHPRKQVADDYVRRLRDHLDRIYGPGAAAGVHERLVRLVQDTATRLADRRPTAPADPPFDERDVLLITYADQIREPDARPLDTLHRFTRAHLQDVVSGVHLLPHYPSTSDDGFAVADYTAVDPSYGTWRDVVRLAEDVDLMLDAVVNHTSAGSVWFRKWQRGDEAFRDFFIELDPEADTGSVVRPRTSPLLTPVDTADGPRWVWTTFSPDQVDLNYANPEVLLAVSEVLLFYVEHGARLLRLDAIAFLWKALGTACIHLPETHEIVKLWRTMLDAAAPGTLIVTETNVPHHENISYFGNGDDEAHLVYQFPLPPLVLAAFHWADVRTLRDWLKTLETPSDRTSFLNFLGSHDGIGLRPVEGLLTDGEIRHLGELVQAHGGGVSYRARPDGSQSPYELNTVYFDALNPADTVESTERQVARFRAAHSILLALQGVPLLYIHALLGSRNWTDGVTRTGRLRTINREKLARGELEAELADPSSLRRMVLDALAGLIRVRREEPAFHPAGAQRILDGTPAVLAIERTSLDRTRRVLACTNVSGVPQRCRLGRDEGLERPGRWREILHGGCVRGDRDGTLEVELPPFGVAWLADEA